LASEVFCAIILIMAPKKNRLLLYFLTALFLIVTPMVILYTQGYAFDWQARKMIKTGGLFFKSSPREAMVAINGRDVKKTNFLSGEVYLTGFLPKEYNIEIKKDGYRNWKKKLEVQGTIVTTAKNIFLLPQTINFSPLSVATTSSTVESFFFSPYTHELYFIESQGQQWRLVWFNSETQSAVPLHNWLNSKKYTFEKADFTYLSRNILSHIKSRATTTYMFINPMADIKEATTTDFTKAFSKFTSVTHDKFNSVAQNSRPWKLMIDGIIWIEDDGYVHKSDFSGRDTKIYNQEPLSFSPENAEMVEYYSEFILRDSSKLYYLDSSEKNFKKISSDVTGFELSPSDPKKVLIWNAHELSILYLADDNDQPLRKKYQLVFLERFSENIKQAIWLNNDYVALVANNTIRIAEIDNRDKINFYDIGELDNPRIYYSNKEKKIYALSQGHFYSSDKLFE